LTFAPCKLSVTSAGGVHLRRGGSDQVVYGSAKLRSGDIISTESSGRAVIQYSWEATRIEVCGSTSVQIQRAQRNKLLRLNAGTLYATVAPQYFFSSLELITSRARATILGTDLKLLSLADWTELEVYSGKVSLAHPDERKGVPIQAGYSGLVAEGRPISAKPL